MPINSGLEPLCGARSTRTPAATMLPHHESWRFCDCSMVLRPTREQGASNVIRNSALCTCLLLGAALAAMGQSRQEDLNRCQSGDPDAKITGCSALIQSGQDTPKNRSIIY